MAEVCRPTCYTLVMSLALAACTASLPTNPVPSGGGGTAGGASGSTGGTSGAAGGSGGMGASTGGSGDGSGGAPAGSGGSSPLTDGRSSADGDDGSVGGDGPSAMPGACAAMFCDDFESYATGGPPGGNWKAALQKGMLAVDATKAFSGARSVRFTHQGAPAMMFIELRKPLLPLQGSLTYGRLMYYITKSPTGQYSHFEIVRGTGPLASGGQAQLNTGAENGKVVVNYEPGDCTKYSTVAFPEKKWTCYQWRFDISKNDIHEWIDGKSADDIPVALAGSCWKSPTVVDTLHIGWESYHSDQPVELWIDDVAVSDQPIPCPTELPSKP